jgi:hypothetical protein
MYLVFKPSKEHYYPKKQDIVFITFGGGGENYYKAVERILQEADGMNIFSKRIGVLDTDLKKDRFFWDRMGTFIETHRRGYGYWCWKSYIIWRQLLNMSTGDILIYLDSGCTFNKDGRERLLKWISDFESKQLDIQMTTACVEHCTERRWTKRAILDYFQVPEEERDRHQYGGGIVFVRKSDKTIRFFKELFDLFVTHPHLPTDETSSEEDPKFVENRHDQSLFSCMLYHKKDTIRTQVIFDGSLMSKDIDPKAPILVTRYR